MSTAIPHAIRFRGVIRLLEVPAVSAAFFAGRVFGDLAVAALLRAGDLLRAIVLRIASISARLLLLSSTNSA